MSRMEKLNAALAGLKAGGVEAAALLSEDGIMIASALAEGASAPGITALSGALMSMASRLARELKSGDAERVVIEGSGVRIALQKAGEHAVLIAVLNPSDQSAGTAECFTKTCANIGAILSDN